MTNRGAKRKRNGGSASDSRKDREGREEEGDRAELYVLSSFREKLSTRDPLKLRRVYRTTVCTVHLFRNFTPDAGDQVCAEKTVCRVKRVAKSRGERVDGIR